MRKVSLTVVRERAQGHTARNMWNQNLIQNFLILELKVLKSYTFWGKHTFHIHWVVLHVLRCAAHLGTFFEINTSGKH